MNISVVKAEYIEGYKIKITFNDKSTKVIDFEKAVKTVKISDYMKYQDLKKFKKFKIEMGNIVWGKDWDLIFPVCDLYNGKIATA